MQNRDKLYIDGAWVASTGTGTIDVINSTTEEVMGTIPEGTAEDVDKAAKAAKAAFESWSQTSVEERGKYLQRITEGLSARTMDIANVVAQEVGMPLNLSMLIQAGLPTMTFTAMPSFFRDRANCLRRSSQSRNTQIAVESRANNSASCGAMISIGSAALGFTTARMSKI